MPMVFLIFIRGNIIQWSLGVRFARIKMLSFWNKKNLDSIRLALNVGPILGLRQFPAAKSPLNMTKNTLCFMLKTLFVLKIFNFFCPCFLVNDQKITA